VVPYADDPDPRRAWALSDVTVARFRIAACPVPAGHEAAADRARATWRRWESESERLLLAVLTETEGGYRLDARSESGAVVAATYSQRVGLGWPGNVAV
jgi:CRISPR-associated endonuclease/helicase Cas3